MPKFLLQRNDLLQPLGVIAGCVDIAAPFHTLQACGSNGFCQLTGSQTAEADGN